jgi:hypothetical protein
MKKEVLLGGLLIASSFSPTIREKPKNLLQAIKIL